MSTFAATATRSTSASPPISRRRALSEAAEQRGLKLGQTSIGADAGGQAQQHAQQQGQPRQATVAVPPRALRSTVAAAESDADDTRLA
jgi:hypothetical protein